MVVVDDDDDDDDDVDDDDDDDDDDDLYFGLCILPDLGILMVFMVPGNWQLMHIPNKRIRCWRVLVRSTPPISFYCASFRSMSTFKMINGFAHWFTLRIHISCSLRL